MLGWSSLVPSSDRFFEIGFLFLYSLEIRHSLTPNGKEVHLIEFAC